MVLPSSWLKAEKSRGSASGAMPTPVSVMVKSSIASSPTRGMQSTVSSTEPFAVNFTAFERRLSSTCRSRVGSPHSSPGTAWVMRHTSSRRLPWACGATTAAASSTTSRTEKGMRSSCTLPASSREKSRMSLINASRPSPQARTVSRYSRCWPVRLVSESSRVMPMTPFIGVRISCDMVARKSLRARAKARAESRAASRPSS